jgi:hypothetical protein
MIWSNVAATMFVGSSALIVLAQLIGLSMGPNPEFRTISLNVLSYYGLLLFRMATIPVGAVLSLLNLVVLFSPCGLLKKAGSFVGVLAGLTLAFTTSTLMTSEANMKLHDFFSIAFFSTAYTCLVLVNLSERAYLQTLLAGALILGPSLGLLFGLRALGWSHLGALSIAEHLNVGVLFFLFYKRVQAELETKP